MDVKETDGPSLASTEGTPSTLTAATAGLQRLDDKLATGMTITDVANVRWLTNLEVLQFMDNAASANFVDYPLLTQPPATPPTTGTLLLYNSAETPNYAQDGIDWVSDPGVKWKSIDRVLAKYGESTSDSDSTTEGSGSKCVMVLGGESGGVSSDSVGGEDVSEKKGGSSSESSSAMVTGASAEYLSCATRNTFHRREYRGPNNIVLLHYLDSVRALRMMSELVDRIVLLSADADANLPPVAESAGSGSRSGGSGTKSSEGSGNEKLGDTMNILMEMVDEHDASGTTVAEAVDEDVLKTATDAAFKAVVKHVAPEEAMGIVDAMEMVMEDDLLANVGGDDGGDEVDLETEGVGGLLNSIEDVTALDIDEAIDQVLSGATGEDDGDDEMKAAAKGGSSKRSVSSSSGSGSGSKAKGAAEIIEDSILDSLDEVLPDDLKMKLINTTEVMLNAAGVSLSSSKGHKRSSSYGGQPPGAPRAVIGSPASSAASAAPGAEGTGHALPEIIDITPDFHVMGYQPLTVTGQQRKSSKKMHTHSMVLSTKSPIPALPPYVDQYYEWERYAAFVDFQEVADDPQVRNVSFNR